MSEIRYVTEAETVALNLYLIRKYSPSETAGVKDSALLNSAINRPKQSVLGEEAYPSIAAKAAALFESLAKNHAFHNANKRTAFTALLQFLKYNHFTLTMEPKQAEDFTVDTVNHKYTFEELVQTIENYTKPMPTSS
ncbi:type II toxin-antitoxin system death-on-curing family toxin (plasmid) [Pseudalkalibacillus hwajinpoensis]|uniref:type II toxin-antitoxin system death-on-curing family toxin n=1 Tax=Guptibacillus hwajinpoensis TaxID=208199 RepID=UPI00325B8B19